MGFLGFLAGYSKNNQCCDIDVETLTILAVAALHTLRRNTKRMEALLFDHVANSNKSFPVPCNCCGSNQIDHLVSSILYSLSSSVLSFNVLKNATQKAGNVIFCLYALFTLCHSSIN